MTEGKTTVTISPKLYEWNLNTVILTITLLAMAAGWGMTWQSTRADINRNTELIAEIRLQIREIDESNQKFQNLDYRLSIEEQATANINSTLRSLENSISGVATDLRVMRSYLERGQTPPSNN